MIDFRSSCKDGLGIDQDERILNGAQTNASGEKKIDVEYFESIW